MSVAIKHNRRVALVHDWLVGFRGGEQVLAQMCCLFPNADIYTLMYQPGTLGAPIEQHRIHTSPLLRRLGSRFRLGLPLFFRAIKAFDLRAYDLIVSSSHCVAHAVEVHGHQKHVCYVHTPMRYIHDQLPAYLPARLRWVTAPMARVVSAPLRHLDRAGSRGIDAIVANSRFVSDRIARVWGRHSTVVYPPVTLARRPITPSSAAARGKDLLFVGALVPYKRADLALALARRAGRRLTVVGRGPLYDHLRHQADDRVRFLGHVSHDMLKKLYESHAALVFPAEEDFGMAPVEAMGLGCPILGVDHGGLRETVRCDDAQPTGVLVAEPSVDALAKGLTKIDHLHETKRFDAAAMHDHVSQFDTHHFHERLTTVLNPYL